MNKTQAIELSNTICDLEKDLCKLSKVSLMTEKISELQLELRERKRNMIGMEFYILKKMIFINLLLELQNTRYEACASIFFQEYFSYYESQTDILIAMKNFISISNS